MSRRAQNLITAAASLAALALIASGDLRPAGVRTAFELLDGSKAKLVVMLTPAESV